MGRRTGPEDPSRLADPGLIGEDIRGSLVGGTALSIHLRHRRSYDLDFMTYRSFSGEHLYRKLASMVDTAVLLRASKDQMNAVINDVAVDVFMAPHRGIRPGYVKQLQKPAVMPRTGCGSPTSPTFPPGQASPTQHSSSTPSQGS